MKSEAADMVHLKALNAFLLQLRIDQGLKDEMRLHASQNFMSSSMAVGAMFGTALRRPVEYNAVTAEHAAQTRAEPELPASRCCARATMASWRRAVHLH